MSIRKIDTLPITNQSINSIVLRTCELKIEESCFKKLCDDLQNTVQGIITKGLVQYCEPWAPWIRDLSWRHKIIENSHIIMNGSLYSVYETISVFLKEQIANGTEDSNLQKDYLDAPHLKVGWIETIDSKQIVFLLQSGTCWVITPKEN